MSLIIRDVDLQYRSTGYRYSKDTVSTPEDVVEYMQGAFDIRPDQEQFWVVFLNARNRPLGRFLATLGTVSSVTVHPREVFRPAIMNAATSIVVAHNHPSGDPSPSEGDKKVTDVLLKSSQIVGIELVDHIIIGDAAVDPDGLGYYSFFYDE